MQKILFGAAYYDEYMPYDRIDTDFKMMKAAGMNAVRIAESTWSTLEPQDGKFDFTHIERMLSYAELYGINVIVGTPTYAVPAWLVRKYPGILAVTSKGRNLYGPRQNMDITDRHYLFHAERVIRRLMEYVSGRSCVIGYQIDNETKYYDAAGEEVQRAFIEYLRKKFPDLDGFNREFGLDYWSNRVGSWKDFPDVRGTINGSLSAEFDKFRRSLVTDFFNWQINIVNEYRRPEQFITHNFDYSWNGFSHGMQSDVNQFQAAANFTVAGTDIYHPSADMLTGEEIAFGGAMMRNLKPDVRNYLVLETQAQGNPGWLPYKGQLRLLAYSHLASGANSVMYWHWHSIHNSAESYWKGVLSHNLKENEIYEEARIIGRELQAVGEKLVDLRKKPEIAVMVNNESLTGLSEFPIDADCTYNDILLWMCGALYRINAEYDIIPQESDHERLSGYKMIIAPAMYSATEQSLERLRRYAQEGGHLIMTFKSAFCDEYLKIYCDDQPHMLTECFGMTYDRFTDGRGVKLADTSFEADGADVKYFMELLQPSAADVLSRYDTDAYGKCAAVTANSYGIGRSVYIGCFFEREALMRLLRNECREAYIDLPDVSYPIVVRTGTNGSGRQITYYMNYSGEKQSLIPQYGGTEILTGSRIPEGGALILDPWGLAIIES